jgi:hypothetical protein
MIYIGVVNWEIMKGSIIGMNSSKHSKLMYLPSLSAICFLMSFLPARDFTASRDNIPRSMSGIHTREPHRVPVNVAKVRNTEAAVGIGTQ